MRQVLCVEDALHGERDRSGFSWIRGRTADLGSMPIRRGQHHCNLDRTQRKTMSVESTIGDRGVKRVSLDGLIGVIGPGEVLLEKAER